MKLKILPYLIILLWVAQNTHAARFIDEDKLWRHVVTVDRLAWEERKDVKLINKLSSDQDFIRRVYLDITGKIPTYEQMLDFLQSKQVNKRQKLIDHLLDSPGYVSYYSILWQDLLRNPIGGATHYKYNEFTRFIERCLYENRPYDSIVKSLINADGDVHTDPAVAFWYRDRDTGPMDTFNATTRAFLGTRLGCAQCHNHRFDKWTQKEFYEAAAFFHGVKYRKQLPGLHDGTLNKHMRSLEHRANVPKVTKYSEWVLRPSLASISFDARKKLTYPENYTYKNAVPNSIVKERIVFPYGDTQTSGNTLRSQFANWMTSKNNPMFARIMPNRLWKRIMGVANMEPIDDYKDNIEVQNPLLFYALGDIFVDVNYDFKAFLSIIFNSEAYQMSFSVKNEFKTDQYKAQGAILKRMSSSQLSDSLLTLQYGNLDSFAKYDAQYFEFEDKLHELTLEYKKDVFPLLRPYHKKFGRTPEEFEPQIIEHMIAYRLKVKELEDYYQVDENGYIKNLNLPSPALTKAKQSSKRNTSEMSGQSGAGSMAHVKKNQGRIVRANYNENDFREVFGMLDRSAPETNINSEASIKQILKMMNSREARNITKQDSYLMQKVKAQTSLTKKISYLYYAIYGRAPGKDEFNIAAKFIGTEPKHERWEKYVLALINSPEFYFIK